MNNNIEMENELFKLAELGLDPELYEEIVQEMKQRQGIVNVPAQPEIVQPEPAPWRARVNRPVIPIPEGSGSEDENEEVEYDEEDTIHTKKDKNSGETLLDIDFTQDKFEIDKDFENKCNKGPKKLPVDIKPIKVKYLEKKEQILGQTTDNIIPNGLLKLNLEPYSRSGEVSIFPNQVKYINLPRSIITIYDDIVGTKKDQLHSKIVDYLNKYENIFKQLLISKNSPIKDKLESFSPVKREFITKQLVAIIYFINNRSTNNDSCIKNNIDSIIKHNELTTFIQLIEDEMEFVDRMKKYKI